MAKCGLEWEKLKIFLKTKSVARNAVDVFLGKRDGTTSIKKRGGCSI